MSPTKQPGVLEIIWMQPDTTDVAATKTKFKAAMKVLEPAEGFDGVLFEGTIREDPGMSLRILKWSSVDAHMKGFRGGPLWPKYLAAREGTITGQSTMKHYQMYDAVPMSNPPECFEFVTIQLKPTTNFDEWYRDWTEALKLVTAFPGCPYIALGQGIDEPHTAIQVQPWETLEAHMVGFKQADNVKDVMAKLTVVVEKYVEGGWKGQKGRHIMVTKPGEAVLDK